MPDNAATVKLTADKSELTSALQDAIGNVKGFGSSVVGVFASLNIAGMALKAFDWAKGLVEGAARTEEANVRLSASFETTGNKSGFSADQIAAMTKQIHELQFISKSAAKEAAVMMSSFENVRGENFQRSLELSADAAKKWGVDVKEASKLVGSSINDPLSGMEKLKERGIVFTEQQKDMANQMIKAGKGAEVQAMILDRLQGSVGGVAAAMGGTFNARMERFYEKMEGVTKIVGGALLGAVEKVLPVIEYLADAFESNVAPSIKTAMDVMQPWIDSIVSYAVPAIQGYANMCIAFWKAIGNAAVSLYRDYIEPAFSWAIDKMGGWAAVVEDVKAVVNIAVAEMVGYFTAWQFVIEKVWEVVQPILTAIGNAVQSLWKTYVAPAFKGMSESISTWKETAVSVLKTFVDYSIRAFSAVEVVLKNFGESMKLVGTAFQLAIVKMYENVKYYFGTVIPELMRWFKDNWKDILVSVWDFTKTVFGNIGANIWGLWDAIKGFAKGKGFNFEWTGLAEGFESSLKELPKIAERERSDLEKSLGDEMDQLSGRIGDKFDETYKANRDRLMSGFEKNMGAINGLTAGEPGETSGNKPADKPKPTDSNDQYNFTTKPDAKDAKGSKSEFKADFVGLEDLGKRIQAAAATNRQVEITQKVHEEIARGNKQAAMDAAKQRELQEKAMHFFASTSASTQKTAEQIGTVGVLS